MTRTIPICFGLLFASYFCQPVLAAPKRFQISILSDGKGTWGRARLDYAGSIVVEHKSFALSITNVTKDVQTDDPRAVVNAQPFTASVRFINNLSSVEMSVQGRTPSANKRALASAYMLTYLVCENVVYPFIGDGLSKALNADSNTEQVVFMPSIPDTVTSKHFGTIPGVKYKVGPVHPAKFSVIPIFGEHRTRGAIAIGWFASRGSKRQWHIRRLNHGETFPRSTHIITATPKDKTLSTMDCVQALTAGPIDDTDKLRSYNRYEIHLKPVAGVPPTAKGKE